MAHSLSYMCSTRACYVIHWAHDITSLLPLQMICHLECKMFVDHSSSYLLQVQPIAHRSYNHQVAQSSTVFSTTFGWDPSKYIEKAPF